MSSQPSDMEDSGLRLPRRRSENTQFFLQLEKLARERGLPAFDAEEMFRRNAELEAKYDRAFWQVFWPAFIVGIVLFHTIIFVLLISLGLPAGRTWEEETTTAAVGICAMAGVTAYALALVLPCLWWSGDDDGNTGSNFAPVGPPSNDERKSAPSPVLITH